MGVIRALNKVVSISKKEPIQKTNRDFAGGTVQRFKSTTWVNNGPSGDYMRERFGESGNDSLAVKIERKTS